MVSGQLDICKNGVLQPRLVMVGHHGVLQPRLVTVGHLGRDFAPRYSGSRQSDSLFPLLVDRSLMQCHPVGLGSAQRGKQQAEFKQ